MKLNVVDLWTSNPEFKYKQHGMMDERSSNEKRAYSVMTSHPIYLQLRKEYGLQGKKRKKSPQEHTDNSDDDKEYSGE